MEGVGDQPGQPRVGAIRFAGPDRLAVNETDAQRRRNMQTGIQFALPAPRTEKGQG
jgi:hypothetical protein